MREIGEMREIGKENFATVPPPMNSGFPTFPIREEPHNATCEYNSLLRAIIRR
jgi:hypothetical protein